MKRINEQDLRNNLKEFIQDPLRRYYAEIAINNLLISREFKLFPATWLYRIRYTISLDKVENIYNPWNIYSDDQVSHKYKDDDMFNDFIIDAFASYNPETEKYTITFQFILCIGGLYNTIRTFELPVEDYAGDIRAIAFNIFYHNEVVDKDGSVCMPTRNLTYSINLRPVIYMIDNHSKLLKMEDDYKYPYLIMYALSNLPAFNKNILNSGFVLKFDHDRDHKDPINTMYWSPKVCTPNEYCIEDIVRRREKFTIVAEYDRDSDGMEYCDITVYELIDVETGKYNTIDFSLPIIQASTTAN